MKRSLLEISCCPHCGSRLEVTPEFEQADRIIEGVLCCTNCSAIYPVHKRLPYLIYETELEAQKKQEMQGWVNLWNKKGMYENPTLEDSFRLPYVGGIWTDVARMFDMALEEMNLQGDELILDIGAGQGWAARYFAEKGCQVVAVDIVADEWYGLGRAWAIMDHAGVYFEPALADGEKLPFFDNTFDIVFLCGALHHFENFERVLAQIYKVLKPGGRIMAAGEPSIAIFARERDVQAILEEVDEGIIERRAKVPEFRKSFERARFENVQIDTFETYRASPPDIYRWIGNVRKNLVRVVRTRYKPVAWLVLSLFRLLPVKMAGSLTLQVNGGNIFVRGNKPSV
jgi:ubiquinone/menaquinone biosynthesis C-methylase UbiE/uncharacterized protein YbaR (Trm112 family)